MLPVCVCVGGCLVRRCGGFGGVGGRVGGGGGGGSFMACRTEVKY